MREAANKLAASDLPLYMACPCRSACLSSLPNLSAKEGYLFAQFSLLAPQVD